MGTFLGRVRVGLTLALLASALVGCAASRVASVDAEDHCGCERDTERVAVAGR